MKPLLLAVFAGVAITIVAYMNDGFFGGRSICTKCGRAKVVSRTYWIPSSRIEETELSRFHDELANGKAHEHEWLFGSGGGGVVTCAIGKGRFLYSAIDREETRQALELIRQHRGDEAARLWLDRLLDPKVSMDAMFALGRFLPDQGDFDAAYAEAEDDFAACSSSKS